MKKKLHTDVTTELLKSIKSDFANRITKSTSNNMIDIILKAADEKTPTEVWMKEFEAQLENMYESHDDNDNIIHNTDNIDTNSAISNLLTYHSDNSDTTHKTDTLILIFAYLELEDANKKLEMTDSQYRTWLVDSTIVISTSQFEILYGLTKDKQKQYRGWHHDPLPSVKFDSNSNVFYYRSKVEQWLENHL